MRNLRTLSRAANRGDAAAQIQLAAMLATGDGADKDTERAAYWYRKAAAKKHPEALYNLGLMYLLGETARGTKKSGRAYIEEAAARGSWDAHWFLGQVYLDGGYGIEKDAARAAYHLVHALGCGYANAALALGRAIREKKGINTAALSDAFVHVAAGGGMKEALDLLPIEVARRFKRRRSRRP